MRKTMKTTESSVLYRKIDELRLSATDRSEAVAALESANRLSDILYWVFKKIGRLNRWFTPNPKLKHQ